MPGVSGYPGRGSSPVRSYARRAPSGRGSRLGSRATLPQAAMRPYGTAPYGTLRRRPKTPRFYATNIPLPGLGFGPLLMAAGFVAVIFLVVVVGLVLGEHDTPPPTSPPTYPPLTAAPPPPPPTTPCFPFQSICTP